MGFDVAALMGFFGLTGAFAVVAAVLAAWMAWRIVEKAGLPGWTGLGAVLLALTAFRRWPRDAPAGATQSGAAPAGGPVPPAPPRALAAPAVALPDRRGWRLTGILGGGGSVALVLDGAAPAYFLTGAPSAQPTDLSVLDPSVGRPHARLLTAGSRLGLEDLGSAGGTFIDGARLLPEHGPRDISSARSIRLGSVDLALARS
jgi:hypothetical protein